MIAAHLGIRTSRRSRGPAGAGRRKTSHSRIRSSRSRRPAKTRGNRSKKPATEIRSKTRNHNRRTSSRPATTNRNLEIDSKAGHRPQEPRDHAGEKLAASCGASRDVMRRWQETAFAEIDRTGRLR